MFLEAQFGAENVDPIKIPRLGAQMALAGALPTNKHEGGEDGASEGSEDEESWTLLINARFKDF